MKTKRATYRVSPRVTATVVHSLSVTGHIIVFKHADGVSSVNWKTRAGAERGLAALAAEFGWQKEE